MFDKMNDGGSDYSLSASFIMVVRAALALVGMIVCMLLEPVIVDVVSRSCRHTCGSHRHPPRNNGTVLS